MKRLPVKGMIAGMTILCAALLTTTANAQQRTTAQPGRLTQESMGNLLRAMGLRPKLEEKRYDFRFKAILNKQEWELSMSSVLSQNGKSIWVMAWLDELPKSAADVPRTALLRLLANNDRMGKGKFFAYIAANRRFVLQRVVSNDNISTASFRDVLKDLGTTVVVTHPHWSVQNWKAGDGSSVKPDPGSTAGTTSRGIIADPAVRRTTIRDSRFRTIRRQ